MECIAVCPDTALPNCSQDLDTILQHGGHQLRERRAASGRRCCSCCRRSSKRTRELMRDAVAKNAKTPAAGVHPRGHQRRQRLLAGGQEEFFDVIDKVPMAYQKANAIFATPEKKTPGGGRHLLDLRLGSLQGVRGVRHGLRRAPGAADGAGNRGGQRRARNAAPRSSTCCPTRRRSISASTTTRGRRTRRPRRCATC